MTNDTNGVPQGPNFRTAMILALLANALQPAVFPMFVAGPHRRRRTCSIWRWALRKAGLEISAEPSSLGAKLVGIIESNNRHRHES